MAEIIGLAASIVAVIQITTSVAKQAYKYGKSVNATQDIAKIQDQLKDVNTVLLKLKDLVDREREDGKSLDSYATLAAIDRPDGALQKYRLAMMTLCTELIPPEEGFAKHKELASWPLKKKKIEKALGDISAQKNFFIIVLGIEHVGQSIEIGHLVSQIFQAQIDDKGYEILGWLSHPDTEVDHKAARKKHEDETGTWFTESDKCRRWKEEPGSFLWLNGIPGSGKTIPCSEIIERIRQYCEEKPTDRALAYFYFSFRDTKKPKVTNFLRSILWNLLRQAQFIPDPVRILFNDYQHTQPPTDRLLSTIKSIVGNHKSFFFIIDALDEFPRESPDRM